MNEQKTMANQGFTMSDIAMNLAGVGVVGLIITAATQLIQF